MMDRLNALRAEALAIHCVGSTPSGLPSQILHVDATDRPDVADLPRVYASELTEPMMLAAAWGYRVFEDDAEVLVRVEVTSPVVCTFAVVVSIRNHGPALRRIVDEGTIILSTICPDHEGLPLIGLLVPPKASSMIADLLDERGE
jgi:hypothetical protein